MVDLIHVVSADSRLEIQVSSSTMIAIPASKDALVPPKIRDLIADLERAGFVNRGGKGSHRNFVHPKVSKPVTISGADGDDAKRYQVRAAQLAIEEAKK
jgi:predicted RNA binding protein YcfA (HicA-like mRNA interferase family)